MKRLVLVGEGQGDALALPVLARKLLRDELSEGRLLLDPEVIRAGHASGLVRWDKPNTREDYSNWVRFLSYAARRKNVAGILAVFDGDAKTFPAGTRAPFCAATAAKAMAVAARETGAGRVFSLAVVFACVEYETWLVAGAGAPTTAGTPVLFPGKAFPTGDPESHGKGWIVRNMPLYRETRDQKTLTEMLDLPTVRAKNLRSFTRLENALDQLVTAARSGKHVSSPF